MNTLKLNLTQLSQPYPLQFGFPDDPKDQLRVKLFARPRVHSNRIQVLRNLFGNPALFMQPHDAIYEGLMVWIDVDQGQRLGLNLNLNTKVVANFRL